MKLVRIDRGGRRGDIRSYETADKRFHIAWQKKQGARSCYRVLDRKTETNLRAFTLEEVRTTIRDMLANDRLLPAARVDMNALLRVRIPDEGEKITRRPAKSTVVYLAVREVRRRLMGSREESRFEAELRDLTADFYATVGRVARSTRDAAIVAACALAKRRGWVVSSKRIGWTTRDAAYERAIAEDTSVAPRRDLRAPPAEPRRVAQMANIVARMQQAAANAPEAVGPYVAATGYAFGRPPSKQPGPPPMLFTDFVTEMHEILREARQTQATDARGRNIELYYGDLMQRLEGAVVLVNERVARRPEGTP